MKKKEGTKVEVRLKFPFYLQLKKQYKVPYGNICTEQLNQLKSSDIEISFLHNQCESEFTHMNTTIIIRSESPYPLNEVDVNFFTCSNCLEIINRVIMAYHASTGSWSNAGFINLIGLTEIQLNAEISLNGNDFRDRKPFQSFCNFPLQQEQEREFEDYLCGAMMPFSRLSITNAILLLEQGQYSLSVLQAIIAIEVHLSNEIIKKLKQNGKSQMEINKYSELTLGGKLSFSPSDDKSAEKYWSNINGFTTLHSKIKNDLNPLRIKIVHYGYIPNKDEAVSAINVARKFIKSIPQ